MHEFLTDVFTWASKASLKVLSTCIAKPRKITFSQVRILEFSLTERGKEKLFTVDVFSDVAASTCSTTWFSLVAKSRPSLSLSSWPDSTTSVWPASASSAWSLTARVHSSCLHKSYVCMGGGMIEGYKYRIMQTLNTKQHTKKSFFVAQTHYRMHVRLIVESLFCVENCRMPRLCLTNAQAMTTYAHSNCSDAAWN